MYPLPVGMGVHISGRKVEAYDAIWREAIVGRVSTVAFLPKKIKSVTNWLCFGKRTGYYPQTRRDISSTKSNFRLFSQILFRAKNPWLSGKAQDDSILA